MKKIGFIGLGIMGRPMVKNLLKAGYIPTVYDKFANFDDLVTLGAKAGMSNKDVAIAEVCPDGLGKAYDEVEVMRDTGDEPYPVGAEEPLPSH